MDRFRRRSGKAAALKKTVSPDGFSYFAAAAIIGTIATNLKSATNFNSPLHSGVTNALALPSKTQRADCRQRARAQRSYMSLTEKFSTSGSLFDNSGTVVGKTRRIRGAKPQYACCIRAED
jgi:hypothetical protein